MIDPHIGLVLPTREAMRDKDAGRIARTALTAEALGFGSLWAGDSLLARPLIDPLATLAHVAGLTSSILLGTGVLLVPLRPPALTAQAIGSLEQLSDGRLIVGAGRGFDLPETRREFAAAGADFATRTSRLASTIELWRRLWTEGRASIDRDWCRLDDEEILPPVVQPGGPPIWLAGQGDSAFDLTGRLADGWLPYPPEPDDYRSGLAAVRAAAATAGRDPEAITPAVMVTISLGERRQAEATLTEYVESFYGYPVELVAAIQACCAGPPDEISAYLRRYWEAGARVFVLRLASGNDAEAQLKAAADHILPALATW